MSAILTFFILRPNNALRAQVPQATYWQSQAISEFPFQKRV